MIAVVDYGAGNVASVLNALARIGVDARVTREAPVIRAAAGVIVPGVGAAADVMAHLTRHGLVEVLRETMAAGTPYLGICMGMQVLFSVSYEDGEHQCLDVIPGAVRRLPGGQPLPHVGWNQVYHGGGSLLFDGIPEGAPFYFVHSYYVDPAVEGWTAATTDYGLRFTSAIARGTVMGTQFHPEKSGRWGLEVLRNFSRMAGAAGR